MYTRCGFLCEYERKISRLLYKKNCPEYKPQGEIQSRSIGQCVVMRETLGGNNKEFIPLETELSILDRYLKLEQLRFGFQYSISVSNSVNASSIEIPALLLQPLVENAVKHGVSELLERGQITINARRDSSTLIITITDNGKGFLKESITENGFGIRLTQERIKLLNQMNKNNPIAISFDKNSEGMVVNLIFKDIC